MVIAAANPSTVEESKALCPSFWGLEAETAKDEHSIGVVFEMDLPESKTALLTNLDTTEEEGGGAYYTDVETLDCFQTKI